MQLHVPSKCGKPHLSSIHTRGDGSGKQWIGMRSSQSDVTVDPERDTAEIMKDYIANFDPRIEALIPTPEQLCAIAADYRVYFAKVPTSGGNYTMDHTASIFLMDADGGFTGTIAFQEPAEMREAKLRKLLKGG
jgi:protein SCO1/2